jgi:hypothetical protein
MFAGAILSISDSKVYLCYDRNVGDGENGDEYVHTSRRWQRFDYAL